MIFESWTKLGGPQAGTVAALVISGDVPTIFIGTKVGVYRSSSFDGESVCGWERLSGAPIGVMSLATSPDFARDHTIIAGADTGIYISKDAGESWRAAQLPASSSMVLALCFSPNFADDGIVIAGTLEDGVWYSESRGERWHARNFGLLDATVFTLAISPNFAQDETVYAGTDTAIYHSYNGARAWKQLDFPESAAPVLSLALLLDSHTLYAGTEKEGLYRSVDQGACWERLSLPAASVNALLTLRDGVLAATESGVFQSTDKGETWHRSMNVPNVICLSSKNEVAIAGLVDQGVQMTTDVSDGAEWRPIAIPPIRSITGLTLSPQFERDHIAFMYGPQEGNWRTQNGGVNWTCMNETLPSLSNSQNRSEGSASSRQLRGADAPLGAIGQVLSPDIHALVVSPEFADSHTVLATSPDGVFISADAGDHWRILTEAPAEVAALSPNGKLLAVAFYEEGIRLSRDLGQTWQRLAGPWDAGGRIVALSVTDDQHFRVAVLEGADDTLSIWLGTSGRFENVMQEPTNGNPVMSFWTSERSNAHDPWYASLGKKVLKFIGSSIVAVSALPTSAHAQREDILALTGIQHAAGKTLFACTGKHLYQSRDATSWDLIHDFGSDMAIAFTPSPSFASDKTAYALLLGGTFCRGVMLHSKEMQ